MVFAPRKFYKFKLDNFDHSVECEVLNKFGDSILKMHKESLKYAFIRLN